LATAWKVQWVAGEEVYVGWTGGVVVVGAVVGAGVAGVAVAVAVAVAVLVGVGAEVVGPRVAVTCGKASVSWLAPETNPVGRRDEAAVLVGVGVGLGATVLVGAGVGIRVTVAGSGAVC